MSKWNLAGKEELCLKRTTNPLFSLDITSSDFFLFGWLKNMLASRSVAKINVLFEVIKNLRILTIKEIGIVFFDWIERLE
jgi:hypothetical protein